MSASIAFEVAPTFRLFAPHEPFLREASSPLTSTLAAAPRARKTFSRLKHVLDLPNLIDIQKASFEWFLEGGLRETINDISPIEDYTGTLAVEFGDYKFGEPQFSIKECREKDLTYQVPLSMTVRFVNKDTGEIREQTVFMGDFPMMTEHGTFIINGTERVIVTQLVRSPGAYLMEPKDATKQVFIANLMPSRGSWLELEIDKKGIVYARIDRKRKLPITTLLRALPAEDPTTGFKLDTTSNEAILKLFDNSPFIQFTLDKDATTREEEALIEVFKKQRPGEPPTLDNARNLLRALFFDPKRYDLTKVGRYKLNQRLGVDVPEDVRVLTTQDILALVQRLVSLPHKLGIDVEAKDFAAEAVAMNRDPIRAELDEYEHFGNRRLRTVGELIQEAFRVGLYRMERVVRERMTTEDVDTITPQTIINIRPVVAALKEFFGSSQLSQFMDQTNSLSGPHAPAPPLGARRRRPHARARADRGPRRPPDPLRAHVSDRDAGRPEHRPHRLARVVRDRLRVRLHPDAVPEGRQGQGHATRSSTSTRPRRPSTRSPRRASGSTRRPASSINDSVLCRSREGEAVIVAPERGRVHGRRPGADRVGRDGADPVPRAQRREPRAHGREHAEAGGSADDHAGAARRHRHRVPRRGRHRRRRRRRELGHGHRRRRGEDRRRGQGHARRVRHDEVHALQPGHAHPPEADRPSGRQGERGRGARRRLDDGPRRARARRQPARRVHAVGGLQLRGRDHPLGAAREGRGARPRSTSTSTRSTPARRSSATRRSRATSRTARRTRSATSTTAASSASAPRSAPATCSSARSRRRARPS